MSTPDKEPSITTFAELGVKPSLIEALASMQIAVPTEVQRDAIPVALSGSDLVAVSQTGSGKTLAYALAVVSRLEQEPAARALVLSPNRETAEQVFQVFMKICAGSSLSLSLAATGVPTAQQAKELKKNPRIIVGTPGRLHDHLASNKLLLKGLQILVVDEADRMLDLGFEEQLRFIYGTLRGERQTLMFAASFGAWAETVAKPFMRPDPVQIRSGAAGAPVTTLRQQVFFLKPGQKQHRLLDELKELKGGVIIFAGSQESCVALGRLLGHHGFSSEFVHGNMNPGHRNRVLREFREEKIKIMVTTDLFARGLDVPTIQTVISYDLPYRGEEFLHRIGRTARAGREGVALTFVTPSDGRTYRRLKQYLAGALETHLTESFEFEERS
jgi:ATP-dependent RNA helicase RhlE